MGYYMNQRGGKFSIPIDKKDAALAAIKALADKPEQMSGGSYQGGKEVAKWYSWVNTEEFVEAETLKEAFSAWRWELEESEEGEIVNLYFNGEKLGDDLLFLEAIAPFVEEGSYIHMEGEDGYYWRWLFKNGRVYEQSGTVVFDEEG
jgi:hypothetical protein